MKFMSVFACIVNSECDVYVCSSIVELAFHRNLLIRLVANVSFFGV